jgi:hypothetical protein
VFPLLFLGKGFFAHGNHTQEGLTMNTNIFTLDLSKKCALLKIGIKKKLYFPLRNGG